LVALALVLLKVSNELVIIGPFDRAQFGWLVPVPMLLIAPAIVGLAARSAGRQAARRSAAAMGLILFIAAYVAFVTGGSGIGCDPHPAVWRVVLISIPVPLVLGVGWSVAGWLSIDRSDRPGAAVAAGIAGAVATSVAFLVTFGALFPGLSCAYVPTPG
jgi:hypothetical protein